MIFEKWPRLRRIPIIDKVRREGPDEERRQGIGNGLVVYFPDKGLEVEKLTYTGI